MNDLTWDAIQKQSNEILSDGLFLLKSSCYMHFSEVTEQESGNYLISLNEKPFYIGEAESLSKRIKQQANPNRSTFYKTYQKRCVSNNKEKFEKIDDFKVQYILTKIGRKEIEESGIVNFDRLLNKFQINKRKRYEIKDYNGLWCQVQNDVDDFLREAEKRLFVIPFNKWGSIDIVSSPGVYLVKNEADEIIYIGEGSNLEERISTHSKTTYFSALRRHIGTEILNYELKEKNGKKKYFNSHEDCEVTNFLRACKLLIFPVNLGRYELEKYLIKNIRPILNRKDNNGK